MSSDQDLKITDPLPPAGGPRRAQALEMIAGSGWFFLLGMLVLVQGWTEARSTDWAQSGFHAWAHLLSRGFVAAYYLLLWILILIRPTPVRTAQSRFQTAVAFLGTYLPLAVPFAGRATESDALRVASALLLVTGGVLIIVTLLRLGRSFSIAPQARNVVRSGPYRFIRHPLYVAEEIAILGSVLQFWSPWTVVLLVVHSAIQVRRMFYEEAVLMAAFPDYRDYAATTARVIPGVW